MSGVGRFSLSLVRPLETAAGPIERREGFLVRLGAGPVGIGEATPLAGWTEGLDACREAIGGAIDEVATLAPGEALPPMAETPAARHGLELAHLDRAARAAGEPLYRYLGGGRRISTLPVNATVGDGGVDETARDAEAAVAEGFGTIKFKVGGRSVAEDLERVRAVRAAVGDAPELRVDANGAWSLDEALSTHSVNAVIEADAADVVVLKPMALGGVGPAKAVAERARAAGLGIVVTTTVDGAVARTAAVHLAAALDLDRACGLATADWLAQDLGSDPAPVVDGGISVPQGAGHGVGVEELD